MSNSDMSAERLSGRGSTTSGDDGRDELKSMLDTIANQLADADRRHMAALGEMQARISGMGREADSLRTRIPNQFAPAFEQIEAGIGELAHRLADAGQASFRETAPRYRAAMPSARADRQDPSDPWDQDSADALAGIYAPGGTEASSSQDHQSRSPGARSSSSIDEAWLESRFAEIARGIEYSLAHVKPETGISDLGERLDHFERQFARLFAGVATHDDLSSVRQIEAHMEEVVHYLEKTNDQLDRLNTLEAQIANVSKTLADLQASPAGARLQDIEAAARAAAEETALRFTATQFEMRNYAADELRPLIEQLMAETRQGGEHTAALLDTMQQAMVRLLDKVEAIDVAQVPPRIFEDAPPAMYSPSSLSGTEADRPDDFSTIPPFPDVTSGSRPYGTTAPDAPPPPFTGGYDFSRPQDDLTARSEKLRQEFIADARRAKMRLSSEGDDLDAELPASYTTRHPAGVTSPSGNRPIRPAKQSPKNTSGPSGPSPRLLLLAALMLLALAGLWYVFGFENRAARVNVRDALHNSVSQGKSDGTGGASEPQQDTPASPPSSKPASPDTNGPRGENGPESSPNIQTTASEEGSHQRTALPMTGVAVDLNDSISAAELQQARRHQAMANLSGELGNAASRPGLSASVPASMVPTEAETEGGPREDVSSTPDGAAKSTPLDLPAATVGPLSLRLAAANGDSSAQFEVGARFAEGQGVKQNFAEAAKWYQRSADQGFAQSQYRLGTLYERGLGLKPDREQAAAWYLRAAEQGNIKAMHNLAVLSANQKDRSPDYTTAARWFEEAAKRGLPDSQFNLAILYENGLGVTRDLKQAYMWLSLAAQGGDDDAVRRRNVLRGSLSRQELAEAQEMVSSWQMTSTDRSINDALVAGGLWKKNSKNGING
jgi:localization factor PodJL